MIAAAFFYGFNNDGFRGYRVDGIKDKFTQGGQLGNVYIHILSHTGAILIGDKAVIGVLPPVDGITYRTATTGNELSDSALDADILSPEDPNAANPHANKVAEINGTYAGKYLGVLMRSVYEGRRTREQFRNDFFADLCDR